MYVKNINVENEKRKKTKVEKLNEKILKMAGNEKKKERNSKLNGKKPEKMEKMAARQKIYVKKKRCA